MPRTLPRHPPGLSGRARRTPFRSRGAMRATPEALAVRVAIAPNRVLAAIERAPHRINVGHRDPLQLHPHHQYDTHRMMTKQDQRFERFDMKVPPGFLERLDQWRRKQPDLPNRSEAIRRLVEAGLKQGKREKRDI